MMTRPPLNGLQARTLREASHDTHDWADAPIVDSHILGAYGAMRKLIERDLDRAEDRRTRASRAAHDAALARCERPAAPIRLCRSVTGRVQEFVGIYRLYRRGGHGPIYSLRMAWGIVVIGRQF